MKYCHNCGQQLPDEAKFCSKCGAKQYTFPAQEETPKEEPIKEEVVLEEVIEEPEEAVTEPVKEEPTPAPVEPEPIPEEPEIIEEPEIEPIPEPEPVKEEPAPVPLEEVKEEPAPIIEPVPEEKPVENLEEVKEPQKEEKIEEKKQDNKFLDFIIFKNQIRNSAIFLAGLFAISLLFWILTGVKVNVFPVFRFFVPVMLSFLFFARSAALFIVEIIKHRFKNVFTVVAYGVFLTANLFFLLLNFIYCVAY